MESNERNSRSGPQQQDWERFGLDGSRNTSKFGAILFMRLRNFLPYSTNKSIADFYLRPARRHSASRDESREPEYHYGHQPSDASEIFAQEHVSHFTFPSF